LRTTRRQLLAGSLAAAGIGAVRPTFAADPIRIGVPTPLSGAYADLGNQAKRAIEFAIDEVNGAGGLLGGRMLEVRFLDTEAKPELARQQGEKLALGGYNLLMAAVNSSEGLAIAGMVDRWNALYISTNHKADDLTGKACNARVFRVNKPDAADMTLIRPWLATRSETKWSVLCVDIVAGHSAAANFKAAITGAGKTVVSENFASLGTSDYAPYIEQISSAGAQGTLVVLAGRDGINFVTQAGKFGLLDKVIIAGTSFITDNVVKVLGDKAKGLWGAINYSATIDVPTNKTFVENWQKKHSGERPSNYEGDAYVGMQLLVQGLQKAGSSKPLDVAKALSGQTIKTIVGEQTVRKADNQLIGPNFFGEVRLVDGTYRPVVTMSLPGDKAFPPPNGSCKMNS
jgi:branched-chain amino acid transport system substrate-binding protein